MTDSEGDGSEWNAREGYQGFSVGVEYWLKTEPVGDVSELACWRGTQMMTEGKMSKCDTGERSESVFFGGRCCKIALLPLLLWNSQLRSLCKTIRCVLFFFAARCGGTCNTDVGSNVAWVLFSQKKKRCIRGVAVGLLGRF